MHKNSITKKLAWSLILKLNSAKPCRKTLLNINENISGHDVDIIYNTKTNNVESKKYKLDEIVKGDSIFCASGITKGDLVNGLYLKDNKMVVNTLITHKSQNTKKIVTEEIDIKK